MGYPMDLDEYTDEQLQVELRRRKNIRDRGLCDYCYGKPEVPSCKFPERHKDPRITPHKT